MISSPSAILAVLAGVSVFFFWLERMGRWRLFRYLPSLLWIYAVPVVLNNVGVLPRTSAAYDGLSDVALPAFLVLLLISVDLPAAVRVMGRGMLVMLAASGGVVIGAVLAYALARSFLPPDAWKLFGALAGAWTGGTGNMAAVAGGMGLAPEDLGVAILADNVIYVIWLPILLASRSFGDRFNRWTKVARERLAHLERAESSAGTVRAPVQMHHVMSLIAITAASIFVANQIAAALPELPPVLSRGTWRTLALTTIALGLSFTRARQIPGARETGLALVYLFLAGMGARASISGLATAPVFLLASLLWIAVHGATCVAAAKLLRVDIHSAAIASAANIGGVASAPVVAAHHRPSLVPVAILMGLTGYAVGNYLAVLTAQLCYFVSTGAG